MAPYRSCLTNSLRFRAKGVWFRLILDNSLGTGFQYLHKFMDFLFYSNNLFQIRARESGFTLIEILVALIVFSLCSVILISQSSSTLANRYVLIEKEMALWLAKNNLAELRLSGKKSLKSGAWTVEKEMGTKLWSVNTIVKPVAVDEKNTEINEGIRQINVQVSARDEPDTVLASITAYVAEY